MSTATFLNNEALWKSISELTTKAKRVDAAIAYFGQGGASLLRLRRGHRLVVDMSPTTVKAGSTDPREIEKLFKRGVEVFTRRNLHAKVLVADKTLITGSANVSRNSHNILDEAALLTTDTAAVRRAREFIQRLCTEPVRAEYIDECKQLYRPPRFIGGKRRANGKIGRVAHPKLWLVNLVSDVFIPDEELRLSEAGKNQALGMIEDNRRSKPTCFYWHKRPRMANELEKGDWIIQCMTWKDKSISVLPPGQFLRHDHWPRTNAPGKERWMFHLAVPRRGTAMSWEEFRRVTKPLFGFKSSSTPRTMAVRDVAMADELLRLWTPNGRISH